MPRTEEILPWAATGGSLESKYPRKNLYFTDAIQEELYDWCVWRAMVHGYETLGGPARSSSELIVDLIERRFRQDMLDAVNAEQFRTWRSEFSGSSRTSAEVHRSALVASSPSDVERSDPRFAAFLRTRSKLGRATRLRIWERQKGRCAVCELPKRLRVYGDHGSARERIDWRTKSPPIDRLAAVCKSCYDRDPLAYTLPQRERPPGRPRKDVRRETSG